MSKTENRNIPGFFITLEGGEGSGKSTQAKLLRPWFEDLFPGREIIVTREPGGTEQAEEIREILVNGSTDKLAVQTEALLMIAARTEHVLKVLKPALMRDAPHLSQLAVVNRPSTAPCPSR